jgi:hypothetical protein
MQAHVFQEKTTGCQMYIWHCDSVVQARFKFENVVIDSNNWVFLKTIKL